MRILNSDIVADLRGMAYLPEDSRRLIVAAKWFPNCRAVQHTLPEMWVQVVVSRVFDRTSKLAAAGRMERHDLNRYPGRSYDPDLKSCKYTGRSCQRFPTLS